MLWQIRPDGEAVFIGMAAELDGYMCLVHGELEIANDPVYETGN